MKVLSNTTSVDKNTLVRLILAKSRSLEVAANMGGLTGQITYGIDSVTSNINLYDFGRKKVIVNVYPVYLCEKIILLKRTERNLIYDAAHDLFVPLGNHVFAADALQNVVAVADGVRHEFF